MIQSLSNLSPPPPHSIILYIYITAFDLKLGLLELPKKCTFPHSYGLCWIFWPFGIFLFVFVFINTIADVSKLQDLDSILLLRSRTPDRSQEPLNSLQYQALKITSGSLIKCFTLLQWNFNAPLKVG